MIYVINISNMRWILIIKKNWQFFVIKTKNEIVLSSPATIWPHPNKNYYIQSHTKIRSRGKWWIMSYVFFIINISGKKIKLIWNILTTQICVFSYFTPFRNKNNKNRFSYLVYTWWKFRCSGPCRKFKVSWGFSLKFCEIYFFCFLTK